jgi:hypothetical protein
LRAGRLEHLRVDSVDQEREDRVGAGDESLELGRLVRILRRSYRHVISALAEHLHGRGRHWMGDDDTHPRTVTNLSQ